VAEPVAEVDPPKIEFPCDYPIKVLGHNVEDYESIVLAVFELHAPGFSSERITRRASSGDKFIAITVHITATGKSQLEALHIDLMATGLVKMVI
jgi:putative lipoic acid-binding regulatory protein